MEEENFLRETPGAAGDILLSKLLKHLGVTRRRPCLTSAHLGTAWERALPYAYSLMTIGGAGMDSTTKLAVAVVAAAVILVCGYVAYGEYSRSRDIDQAQQALDALRQNAQQAVEQGRRVVQVSEQQQAAEQAWQQHRRRLAVNQRCVGGVVIQVQGNTYTQLGTIAQPVHCSGGFADQPLR